MPKVPEPDWGVDMPEEGEPIPTEKMVEMGDPEELRAMNDRGEDPQKLVKADLVVERHTVAEIVKGQQGLGEKQLSFTDLLRLKHFAEHGLVKLSPEVQAQVDALPGKEGGEAEDG